MLAVWLPQHTLMVSAVLAVSSGAIEPFQLVPYPQKVHTFYSLTDATVPAALQSNSVPLPVGSITANARTTDGALWLGTTQGLMRLDLSAPQRDRRQYFAGRRYLPDDLILQSDRPGREADPLGLVGTGKVKAAAR